MALIQEQAAHEDTLVNVAKLMIAVARTAPKAKGISSLTTLIITGNDLQQLAAHTNKMGESYDLPGFIRDSANVKRATVAVAFGCKIEPIGLKKCGMCGFKNCDEKRQYSTIPCVFNTGDLGIAMGSALSIAADNRVDNRVMYSLGQALLDLGWMGEDIKIAYVVPLSISSKSVFFDR
jgi:uncharacterized ferredoxin-like protein